MDEMGPQKWSDVTGLTDRKANSSSAFSARDDQRRDREALHGVTLSLVVCRQQLDVSG